MYVAIADYHSSEAAEVFCESLKKTGFAVLTNHPVDTSLFEQIYNEWQTYFTSSDKHHDLFNKDTQDGYFPITVSEIAKGHTVRDIKEFFHVYPWGKYPQKMSASTLELYHQLNKLAQELLAWIEQNTPKEISSQFSMPLSQMVIDSPRTLLRILNYPPLTGDEEEGAVRAAAHEDINLITLLPAATATGLQVQDMTGMWHNVTCDPGSIVVNIGDMLQLCSKGYYRSTTHRVINPSGETAMQPRLSMPLFLHPRDEVKLSDNHTGLSYLHERLRELGLL